MHDQPEPTATTLLFDGSGSDRVALALGFRRGGCSPIGPAPRRPRGRQGAGSRGSGSRPMRRLAVLVRASYGCATSGPSAALPDGHLGARLQAPFDLGGCGPWRGGIGATGKRLGHWCGSGSWAVADAVPSPFDSQRRCVARGHARQAAGTASAPSYARYQPSGQHERPQRRGQQRGGGKPGQGAGAESQ
jgi:hypothetical protein